MLVSWFGLLPRQLLVQNQEAPLQLIKCSEAFPGANETSNPCYWLMEGLKGAKVYVFVQ